MNMYECVLMRVCMWVCESCVVCVCACVSLCQHESFEHVYMCVYPCECQWR